MAIAAKAIMRSLCANIVPPSFDLDEPDCSSCSPLNASVEHVIEQDAHRRA
jgi:hypothetical protein